MYSREGTLTKNLRNISPIFGREEPDADLLRRTQATFGSYVKKIDGRKVCPPGCIVDTCQPRNQASGIFRKKRKSQKKRKSKKLKKRRTKKNRKLP